MGNLLKNTKSIALLKETIVMLKTTLLRNHLMALQCVFKANLKSLFQYRIERLHLLRKSWVFMMADSKIIS